MSGTTLASELTNTMATTFAPGTTQRITIPPDALPQAKTKKTAIVLSAFEMDWLADMIDRMGIKPGNTEQMRTLAKGFLRRFDHPVPAKQLYRDGCSHLAKRTWDAELDWVADILSNSDINPRNVGQMRTLGSAFLRQFGHFVPSQRLYDEGTVRLARKRAGSTSARQKFGLNGNGANVTSSPRMTMQAQACFAR